MFYYIFWSFEMYKSNPTNGYFCFVLFFVNSSSGRNSTGDLEKGSAAGPSSALDSSSESVDGDQKPGPGLDHPTAQTMLSQVSLYSP